MQDNATEWRGDKTFCQNPNCPNDHNIDVQVFKGEGYCSADCQKVLGERQVAGNLVFLSAEEERAVKAARTEGKPLGRRGKRRGR